MAKKRRIIGQLVLGMWENQMGRNGGFRCVLCFWGCDPLPAWDWAWAWDWVTLGWPKGGPRVAQASPKGHARVTQASNGRSGFVCNKSWKSRGRVGCGGAESPEKGETLPRMNTDCTDSENRKVGYDRAQIVCWKFVNQPRARDYNL
jgi:hypothetical protein